MHINKADSLSLGMETKNNFLMFLVFDCLGRLNEVELAG